MFRQTWDTLYKQYRASSTVHVHHDKTNFTGVVAGSDGERIFIRDANDDIFKDKIANFSMTEPDGVGWKRVKDVVVDLLGRPVEIGDWITFAASDGLAIAKVLRIARTGTVIADAFVDVPGRWRGRRFESRMPNWSFIRLPSDDPGIADIRDRMETNTSKYDNRIRV